MSVTTLPWGRELTAADLARMPDDGHRYELIDGALIVTPSPSREHQRMSARLFAELLAGLPADLDLVHAPLDVAYSDKTVVQPDLLVIRKDDFLDLGIPLRPVLVVEILSPSTRMLDLNSKKVVYEKAGCPSYWTVDPDDPRLIAWDLHDGVYAQVADVSGEQTWTSALPYPVTITPARLLD